MDTNTNVLMTTQDTGSSFTDSIKNISIITWVLIVLLLAILGFNIFTYLAFGTQELADFFGPLTTKLIGIFAAITGKVVNVTAHGAEAVVDTAAYGTTTIIDKTAGAIDVGLNAIQNVTSEKSPSSLSTHPIQTSQPPDIMANNTLNTSLNKNQIPGQTNNYQADDSSSLIQSGTGKSGWCFIGEDRGFRSCVEVGVNDKCMSGDIFPTKDVCINPSLRA